MDDLEKALKKGCPPEVAGRSRFPNAMDRNWVNLGTIKVPREYPAAYKYACPCALRRERFTLSPGPTSWCADFLMWPVFRSWYEGECDSCKTLYCVKLWVDAEVEL